MGHFKVTGLAWNGKKVGPDSCRNSEKLGEDNELTVGSDSGLSPESKNIAISNTLSVGCSSQDSIQVRAKSQCDNMDVFAGELKSNTWLSLSDISLIATFSKFLQILAVSQNEDR